MSKKHIIIPIVTFLLGAFVVHMAFFTISDISGYAPSYTDPLTEEEFTKAQEEGEASFNGPPTTEKNKGYSIETLIHCHKETSVCDVASANIVKYTSGPSLQPSLQHYKITQWSDEGIIEATFEYEPISCGIYSLQANVKTREVTMGYKPHADRDKEACADEPFEGNKKLDFNMDSKPLFGSSKSDVHYFIGEMSL